MYTINGTVIDQIGVQAFPRWAAEKPYDIDACASLTDARTTLEQYHTTDHRAHLMVHLAGKGWVTYDPLYHVIEAPTGSTPEPRCELTMRADGYAQTRANECGSWSDWLAHYRAQCERAALQGDAQAAYRFRVYGHGIKRLMRDAEETRAEGDA